MLGSRLFCDHNILLFRGLIDRKCISILTSACLTGHANGYNKSNCLLFKGKTHAISNATNVTCENKASCALENQVMATKLIVACIFLLLWNEKGL